MTWKVEITEHAYKQLNKLDKPIKQRITRFLSERLCHLSDPRILGKALQGTLSEYWAYRVGNYRLLATIEDNTIVIVLVEVEHRKQVYKNK